MTPKPDQRAENWAERFEHASWLDRAALLGGGAVRLAANAINSVIERAAAVAVDAEKAFRGELDPNVSDAKVIEEVEER